MHRLALATVLAALPAAAFADCAPLITPSVPIRLTEATAPAATVTGWVPRIPLVKDKTARPACPDDTSGCEDAASVTPSDAVVVNKVVGDYACITVPQAEGPPVTRWLGTLHLALIARSVPGPDEWLGDWVAPEKSITIAATASGDIALTGSATWGGEDPDRAARGAVNTGEFTARLQPHGAVLGFTVGLNETLPYDKGEASDCRIQLVRRGPFLIAEDDGQCGGNNVSFTAIYRRRG